MSDIVTVRDPDVIAAEINTIKRQVREAAIFASIRIGEKLTEVKSMVPHGQWGKWLEENVEYSQSTANYLMQLYQEYGTGQQDLFDTWTNSQTFGRLSYSQHIALLALPFGERQKFAEEAGAEELSARQLKQAIREREEAIREKELARKETEAAKAEADRGREAAEAARIRTEEMMEGVRERARKAEAAQKELEERLEKALNEATEAEKKLEKLRKAPVPEDLLAALRREAEEAAAQKAAETAGKRAEEAEKAVAEAVRRAQEAREEAERLRRQTRMGDADIAVFKTLFTQIQEDWNRCHGALIKMKDTNPEGIAGCRRAMEALMEKIRRDLEGV